MERIYFVKNDQLDEINEELQRGGKVKMIHTVYGIDRMDHAIGPYSTEPSPSENWGNVYGYVVIDKKW